MKVSVFVELHRSTRRLEKMNAELALLSKHLLEAQDNERRCIARDLHDGLGQELTYAKMMLDGYMRLPAGQIRKGQSPTRVWPSTGPFNRSAAFPTCCTRPC